MTNPNPAVCGHIIPPEHGICWDYLSVQFPEKTFIDRYGYHWQHRADFMAFGRPHEDVPPEEKKKKKPA